MKASNVAGLCMAGVFLYSTIADSYLGFEFAKNLLLVGLLCLAIEGRKDD